VHCSTVIPVTFSLVIAVNSTDAAEVRRLVDRVEAVSLNIMLVVVVLSAEIVLLSAINAQNIAV